MNKNGWGESIRIKDFKEFSLYINTSGYAFTISWPGKKRRDYYPNEKGQIFIKGKKINLKRLIYKACYPKLSLKGKFVVKYKGNLFSLSNLALLSKNEFGNWKKNIGEVLKDEKTGNCNLKID